MSLLAATAGCGSHAPSSPASPPADAPPRAAVLNPAQGPAAVPGTPLPEPGTVQSPPADAAPQTSSPQPTDAAAPQSVAAADPETAAAPPAIANLSPAETVPEAAPDPAESLIAAVGATDLAAAPGTTGPRETKLLIPEKSFQREGDALRVSYDDLDLLKVLNMEPVTPNAPDLFPQWLQNLEGQRIRIRGYMRPGELAEDIPFFVLARDTQACCFGPNTKAYDIIPVIMREGVTTDYIHLRPFDIVGEFHIGVEMDFANPDKVEFLYRIEDAVLIEK